MRSVTRRTRRAILTTTAVTSSLAFAVALATLPTGATGAPVGPFNPVDPASGFLTYVAENAKLVTNESEGTLAVGGDLIIGGYYQLALHDVGDFTVPGETLPTSLVVGGAVDWAASVTDARLAINLPSYVHIGDMTGTFARWTDNNGADVNTRILPSDNYDAYPRIELTTRQNPTTVGRADLLDFSTAFATMSQHATAMATCAQNVTLTDSAGTPMTRPIPPDTQVTVALTRGVTNVLNLTSTELNNISILRFATPQTADAPFIINVDTSDVDDDFVWDMPTIDTGYAANYILWNFPTATQITQPLWVSASVEGTIYAPNAHLFDDSPGNNEGSIIVKSLVHGSPSRTPRSGEIHNFPFLGTVSCVAPTTTPSPTGTTAAPTQTTLGPTPTTAAPSETTASPTGTTASPTETTASPTGTTASPMETTASPTETTVSPSRTTAGPAGTTHGPGMPTVRPTGSPLPVTGSPASGLTWAAAGLLATGTLCVVVARRRRDQEA
ncbi:collagen-binding domain-containing protein [Luedemannella helvata]|uniref:Choice-of-anchor A domain-containing protein n=1 Tax=Luedemannella helvata TaxID=349315 RepID=A0ABP4WKY2_9ACTN